MHGFKGDLLKTQKRVLGIFMINLSKTCNYKNCFLLLLANWLISFKKYIYILKLLHFFNFFVFVFQTLIIIFTYFLGVGGGEVDFVCGDRARGKRKTGWSGTSPWQRLAVYDSSRIMFIAASNMMGKRNA